MKNFKIFVDMRKGIGLIKNAVTSCILYILIEELRTLKSLKDFCFTYAEIYLISLHYCNIYFLHYKKQFTLLKYFYYFIWLILLHQQSLKIINIYYYVDQHASF